MTERTFVTELINEGRQKAVDVYELDGAVIVHLEPGQRFTIESRSPYTAYARWSEVRWAEDGKLHFVPRPGFTEPQRGRWVLQLLNEGGEPIEWRTVGGEHICLPRSVMVLAACPLTDPLIMYRSLTVVKKRVMIKDVTQVGYIIHEWRSEDEKEPRSAADLKAIEKIVDELGKGKD